MLTGGIKFEDPYDVFEARFLVNAKRACTAFAVVALALGAHDLSSRSLASVAYASAHEIVEAPSPARTSQPDISPQQEKLAAVAIAPPDKPKLDQAVTAEVAEKISKKPAIGSADPVAVSIPRSEPSKSPAPVVPSSQGKAKVENAAVAELATARHLDAIEVAMASGQAMAKATPADLAPLVAATPSQTLPAAQEIRTVAAPMPRAKPVKLASLNPAALPAATVSTTAKPAMTVPSLPATISVLPRPAPRPRLVPQAQAAPQSVAPVASVSPTDSAPAQTQPAPVTPAAVQAPSVQLASLDPEAVAIGSTSAGAEPLVSQFALPSTIKVLPPPAPGVPPPSPAQRLHLEGEARAKAEKCLANAIYFEARDQPYKGQVAVAQVVMNRVFSGVYPRDVCGVIYQNANRHLACQFTFACDGKRKVINERAEWARARRIARDTLDGVLYVQAVGTATHYHANYVHPNWVREMKRYAREGVHLFYRPIAWGNGADEPRWSREQKKKK